MSLSSKLTAWGRLLRLPNLLTVPGDPLVGFVIVAGASVSWANPALWAAMGASVLLYAAGLIHNDLCDLAEDRRDRPNRPLACGAISTPTAAMVAIALTASACTLAWLFCGPTPCAVTVLLALTIFAYNAICKRNALLGPVTMGLCRGLSLLLGASVALTHNEPYSGVEFLCWLTAVIWIFYIAAVTFLASRETQSQRLGGSRYLPVIPMLISIELAITLPIPFIIIGKLSLSSALSPASLGWLCIWSLATINAASPTWKLRGIAQPADIQRMIGRLIRNLLLMQSAVLFGAGQWQVGIVFLILHPIHARLARWFYAS